MPLNSCCCHPAHMPTSTGMFETEDEYYKRMGCFTDEQLELIKTLLQIKREKEQLLKASYYDF